MTIVRSMLQHGVSLNRALKLCGMAKKRWYYEPKQREMAIDLDMLQMIREIRDERPFYGTRRMAAEMSRRLGRMVNCKTVRRIYRRMGWDESQRMRVPKVRWTPIRTDRPNEVWETDPTLCLVRSGGWVMLLLQHVGCLHPAVARLPVRHADHCRHLHQATGRCSCPRQTQLSEAHALVQQHLPVCGQEVQEGRPFGHPPSFIRTHTLEQNSCAESFHGAFRHEYIWPYNSNYQEARAVMSETFRTTTVSGCTLL